MSSTNETDEAAKRFLAVRVGLGLSQQAFADALNISLRTEQNYERGDRRLSAEVLLALAKVYSIDPLWVLEGPEEAPRYLASAGNRQDNWAKAMRVVMSAVARSEKKVTGDQLYEWVLAVYRFYTENGSGKAAESLVRSLIGGKGL